MRLIFAGTPEFAAVALEALIAAGHEVALVLTQPDRPAGRGMKLVPSAVKQVALQHGLEVAQPANLKTPESWQRLREVVADVMVVAAYGLLLPAGVLTIPRHGCLNIHASLLPRWRGAAPIQRAILAGDEKTGITIMQMDVGLDTGDMCLVHEVPIASDDTAQSLHDKLAQRGGTAIVEALQLLQAGALPRQPQDNGLATYASKLTKAEGQIDWSAEAVCIERAIRAYQPFPVAYTLWHGEPLRLFQAQLREGRGVPGTVLAAGKDGIEVACGRGSLLLTELQKTGGKRMPVAAFLSGNSVLPGETFGMAD